MGDEMIASCPICQNKNAVLVTDKLRFGKKANIMECKSCGQIYLDQNSFQFPKDFYEADYHQTYLTHIDPSAFDPKAYYKKMLKTTKLWVEKVRGLVNKDDTVLDFGCSTGHLITSLAPDVKKIYGCELNRKEVDFCRNELKIDVSDEPLEKRFCEGTFDFILMMFVLEHIAEPEKIFRQLKRLLKANGKIVILVPNVRDALLRFYDIPKFGEFYFCMEHLFYYSPKTLEQLLERSGLAGRAESIQEYPVTNHLNWGYRQSPSDLLASRLKIPDIAIRDAELAPIWEDFWVKVDQQYKVFLKANGFGDRVWCVAGKK